MEIKEKYNTWLWIQVLAKVHEDEFRLLFKGTTKYLSRVGAGALDDAFENAIYIKDGHEVIHFLLQTNSFANTSKGKPFFLLNNFFF